MRVEAEVVVVVTETAVEAVAAAEGTVEVVVEIMTVVVAEEAVKPAPVIGPALIAKITVSLVVIHATGVALQRLAAVAAAAVGIIGEIAAVVHVEMSTEVVVVGVAVIEIGMIEMIEGAVVETTIVALVEVVVGMVETGKDTEQKSTSNLGNCLSKASFYRNVSHQ